MTTTTPPALALGPIEGLPGASHEDEWIAVARDVAAQLAVDAVDRDRAGAPPVAEAALMREAGLLPLLASEEVGGHGRPYAVALSVIRQIAQVDSGLARLLAYHYAWSNRLASDFPSPDRIRDLERRAVESGWIVASTGSPLDGELDFARTRSGELRISGTKYFATAARVADRILGFGNDPDSGERLVVEIDTTPRAWSSWTTGTSWASVSRPATVWC